MCRLMRMIGQNCAQHEACLRLFADWEKDAGVTSGVLPLRLGAALHALVLEKIIRLGRGVSAKHSLGSGLVEHGFGRLSTTRTIHS